MVVEMVYLGEDLESSVTLAEVCQKPETDSATRIKELMAEIELYSKQIEQIEQEHSAVTGALVSAERELDEILAEEYSQT